MPTTNWMFSWKTKEQHHLMHVAENVILGKGSMSTVTNSLVPTWIYWIRISGMSAGNVCPSDLSMWSSHALDREALMQSPPHFLSPLGLCSSGPTGEKRGNIKNPVSRNSNCIKGKDKTAFWGFISNGDTDGNATSFIWEIFFKRSRQLWH